jgi:hypothetical protein
MLFLEQSTPNTINYLILGYSVFFLVSGIYLLSIWIRQRDLLRQLADLTELEKKMSQIPKLI